MRVKHSEQGEQFDGGRPNNLLVSLLDPRRFTAAAVVVVLLGQFLGDERRSRRFRLVALLRFRVHLPATDTSSVSTFLPVHICFLFTSTSHIYSHSHRLTCCGLPGFTAGSRRFIHIHVQDRSLFLLAVV